MNIILLGKGVVYLTCYLTERFKFQWWVIPICALLIMEGPATEIC